MINLPRLTDKAKEWIVDRVEDDREGDFYSYYKSEMSPRDMAKAMKNDIDEKYSHQGISNFIKSKRYNVTKEKMRQFRLCRNCSKWDGKTADFTGVCEHGDIERDHNETCRAFDPKENVNLTNAVESVKFTDPETLQKKDEPFTFVEESKPLPTPQIKNLAKIEDANFTKGVNFTEETLQNDDIPKVKVTHPDELIIREDQSLVYPRYSEEQFEEIKQEVINQAKEKFNEILGDREKTEKQIKTVVQVSTRLSDLAIHQSNLLTQFNEAINNDAGEEELIEMILSLAKQSDQRTSKEKERRIWAKSIIKKLRQNIVKRGDD